MRITRSWAALALAAILSGCGAAGDSALWRDKKVPIEKRIADRIRDMSLDQKLEMLSGVQAAARPKDLPPRFSIAASWDVDLATADGRAFAHRAIAAGRDQVIGPDLNSYGDDPWLISAHGHRIGRRHSGGRCHCVSGKSCPPRRMRSRLKIAVSTKSGLRPFGR